MQRVVKIKDLTIGEGMPKICVPMVGESLSQLVEEADFLKNIDFDLVEWRVDFFEDVTNIDKVKEALQVIREILMDKPLIFTFRSASEGGEKEFHEDFYFELNKAIVDTKLIDIIDLELFKSEKRIKEIIKSAHDNDISVIVSNHDFQKTPPKEDIINRLCKAAELGGDIPKVAVMPTSAEDVLALMDATRIAKEKHIDNPIITMSMSGKGVISRLSGEIFGSALTFGAANKTSAPGQVSVMELRKILQLLHYNL